ncbi:MULTISPECIES: IclR family transcriptional regulator [Cupriavidus]|uniref:IclR family transcriptional regulator n=1 Tax=Cupriavidus TaxID=106589 RepID=UPI0009DBAC9D|nr:MULTISPECIES: helix-turn-helix domain-containing protein [Cupriavidus]
MPESPIKTSKRVFEIFEAFENVQRPMALKDFTQRFGYPPSSASAVLKSLVALGYLDYDRFSRTYMPTMRITSLGNWIQQAIFGQNEEVLRLMQQLSEAFGECITLSAQSDLYVQYVYLIPSRLPIWYSVPIGTIRPLARSGSGWIMLGARTDAEIEELVRRINFHEPDPARKVKLAELMAHVEQGRRDGYLFNKHTLEPGAGGICMVLPERRFGRLFALAVSGPVERLETIQERVIHAMREGIAALDTAAPRPAGGVEVPAGTARSETAPC